jgi:hypothetical protein
MDREITFALMFAVAASAAIGSYFFSGTEKAATRTDRLSITYSPDDIRYPFQQAERKALEKKQRAAQRRARDAAETPQDAPETGNMPASPPAQ